jgi:hypothetical protein
VIASRAERLDLMRRTPEELARVVADVRSRGLEDTRPGDGEWSPREVMAHLADAEMVYAVRARLIVAGAVQPHLEAYDEELWTARFAGLETLGSALERWRVTREATLRLFDSLSEGEWARTGLHSERGVESVETQLERIAEHDTAHLEQMLAMVEG